MRDSIFILILLSFVLAGVAIGQTDNNDTQFWNLNSIEIPLDKDNEKLSGVILTDMRLTNNISDFTDQRVGFGVRYRVKDNLTIQSSYMFRSDNLPDTPARYEHHLMFDVTPVKRFKHFSIDNRSRLEHRIKTQGGNDDTFYRNRTQLRIPVKKEGKAIVTPFVWSDIWFDLHKAQVLRNDASAGITRRFNKKVSADFYYLYRRNIQSGTKNENVIGINLNINK